MKIGVVAMFSAMATASARCGRRRVDLRIRGFANTERRADADTRTRMVHQQQAAIAVVTVVIVVVVVIAVPLLSLLSHSGAGVRRRSWCKARVARGLGGREGVPCQAPSRRGE